VAISDNHRRFDDTAARQPSHRSRGMPARMTRWQRLLFAASRSQAILWRFAIGMLLLGVLAGYAASKFRPSRPERLLERVIAALPPLEPDAPVMPDLDASAAILPALAAELRDPAIQFGHVVDIIPTLAHLASQADPEELRTVLARRFTAGEADLAVDLFVASGAGDVAARARLEALARSEPPPRFAHHALGLLAQQRGEHRDAYAHFQREGVRPEAVASRREAVSALVALDDFAALTRLREDPLYADLISSRDLLQHAVATRDWRTIILLTPIVQITSYETGILVITIISGVAWAFFLVHLGEPPGWFSKTSLVYLLAFVAGALSTTVTLYVVFWQDDMLHFSPEGEVLQSFLYFVGGVGVREELCKLLFFLPFLPWLRKRDDDLAALLVASFVGLGFAIEENGNYFLMTHGTSAPARFLTANFFHVALTGVNGLYLFRAFSRGFTGLNDFLAILAVSILAHGFYDALPDLPDAQLGGFLAMVVYVGYAMLYFHRANELRTHVRTTISLTGSFVFGVSLLAAAVIAYQMINLGPAAGARVIFPELLGSAGLLLIFFRVVNEQLAS
jgi:RsiW-degrading membrane proteinase PrsW (M82 family)